MPDYSRIPRHTLKTLERWIATGRYLDDDDDANAFLLAVLMHDLEAAIMRADEANQQWRGREASADGDNGLCPDGANYCFKAMLRRLFRCAIN
jgi:hypothetical protein